MQRLVTMFGIWSYNTVSDGSKSVSKCLNQAHLGYSLNCIFKKNLQKVIEFV